MNTLFADNRLANMLQYFRNTSVITVSTLASKLDVSDRTVRNDIKQLNDELHGCAVIEGMHGKYSLRIFDEDRFRDVSARLMQMDDFLNSSQNRMDYIFGRLMRSEQPLLTDELAYEMNVGRTTLVSDLKKLRIDIAPYQLSIIGKTSQGLILRGEESDIRKYVLDNRFERIYREYPLDQDIVDILSNAFAKYSFESSVRQSFERFLTLMLDRFLTGHYIGSLPQKYYDLTSHRLFPIADELIEQIGVVLRIEFPLEEKLFVLLPIIGMRTPADLKDMHAIQLDNAVRMLMQRVLRQIDLEMDITIEAGEFTEEFLYHLMFMINRLKFHVQLKNPVLDELQEKYPLAYQMSGIAARVIHQEYGLVVNEDERGYLASYFGVFLAENDLKQQKRFRVAVVCGTGRVTARLIAAQLKKVLDSSAELMLFADEKVDQQLLNGFDIVLTTVQLPCETKRPVIRIHEIFNERELLHKIEKAKYWDQVDVPVLDNNWFVMTGLLDESRFFVLDDVQSYDEAVYEMVMSLTKSGQVDDGFLDRLRERERKGTMVFDHSIAIPHSIQYAGDKLVLAIGVFPHTIQQKENDIRVIFLLALPEQAASEDNLLIRVYDEIISISQDSEMLSRIAAADSFQALLRALFRQAIE